MDDGGFNYGAHAAAGPGLKVAAIPRFTTTNSIGFSLLVIKIANTALMMELNWSIDPDLASITERQEYK